MNGISLKKSFLWLALFVFISHIFFSIGYSNIKIKTADLKLIDDDAYIYRDIAENGVSKYFNDHRSSRILVPGLSYAISKINFLDDKFNTPGSNIFFVSSVLCFFSLISLFYLGRLYFDDSTSLLACVLFMVSFSMSNYMFMGYPDSAEFLLSTLLFLSLALKKYWYILPIFLIAALNRESFILFSLPLLMMWLILFVSKDERKKFSVIIFISSLVFMSIFVSIKFFLQGSSSTFSGQLISWINFEKFKMYFSSNHLRMLMYPMLFLLQLGLIGSYEKKELFFSVCLICSIYFIVGGLFIGSGAAVGRYLFSSVGPILLISQSYFLLKIYTKYYEAYNSNTMPK